MTDSAFGNHDVDPNAALEAADDEEVGLDDEDEDEDDDFDEDEDEEGEDDDAEEVTEPPDDAM